jgi:hypothetical protein
MYERQPAVITSAMTSRFQTLGEGAAPYRAGKARPGGEVSAMEPEASSAEPAVSPMKSEASLAEPAVLSVDQGCRRRSRRCCP